MENLYILAIVILFFSVVQSVLGVGLLVFGTPTLLLLGASFDETIAFLLPCSIVINFFQVLQHRKCIGSLKTGILIYTVPMLVVGLVFVLGKYITTFEPQVYVGAMLILTAVIRFFKRIQDRVASFLKNYLKIYLLLMGFIHGISNMGGGLLTVLVATIYSDKKKIRTNVAHGYLVMGIFQVLVLVIMKPAAFRIEVIPFAIAAGAIYHLLGNRFFNFSSEKVYQALVTLLTFVYGILLAVK